MRNEMSNNITIDDLTWIDFSILRCEHRKLRFTSNCQLSDKEFVNSAIDNYNKGDYSIIAKKSDKVIEDKPADKFAEVTKCIIAPEKPVSNIGKKIYLESSVDGCYSVILVGTSEEADPDNGKISIYSDLGKLLQYAQEGKYIELNDDIVIEVVKISSYTIPSIR